tara:strand:+ start:1205 stop:1423 length:219 start_codon:yes stop_codon:yes gene_type:complete
MMKNEDLDLVFLCTSGGLNAQQAEIVAKYGVDVIAEKPMATRWHDGLRSLELLIATYLSVRDDKRVSLSLDY